MKSLFIAGCLLSVLMAPATLAQGIPLVKSRQATMQWLTPPTVNLVGKSIRIESKTVNRIADADTLPELLKTKLITMIQKDSRFRIDEVNPQTILRFSITNGYTETFEGHDRQGNPYRSFRGRMEVSYQALDVASSRALDSENLSAGVGYEQKDAPLRTVIIGHGKASAPLSVNETWDRLVDMIILQMTLRVAPVALPISVELPGGKLVPIGTKAMSGLWAEVFQDAEAFPPFAKPTDDIWRTYLMALAKEAMAYNLAIESANAQMGNRQEVPIAQALKEAQDAERYLYEANQLYRQILQVKADDKVLVAGQIRVSRALNTYGIIIRNLKEPKVVAGGNQGGGGGGTTPPPPSLAVKTPLDNVLASCKAKLPPEQVADYIRSADFIDDAKATNFRLKFPDDAIKVNEACGDAGTVLVRLMRTRLAGSPAPAAPVNTPAPPARATTPPARTPTRK